MPKDVIRAKCNICGETKTLDEFAMVTYEGDDIIRARCKKCERTIGKARIGGLRIA